MGVPTEVAARLHPDLVRALAAFLAHDPELGSEVLATVRRVLERRTPPPPWVWDGVFRGEM